MASGKPAVDEVFADAIRRARGEERTSFLDEACGDDSQLRHRVDRLLQAYEEADSFLESPAATGPAPTMDMPAVIEQPGSIIGPYKLLQKLGEGGMGVVYMAEQDEPVARRVALKVIKPGMDTGQVIARFEAERQALAMMDHPGIAKVFDAGATESGRPYFAMELVKGIPVTQYCDEEHFTPKQRLQLFVQVCHAVQHAHQKGIIHRDIKPTNVLVAEYDQKPVPKVIDFGVAKATTQKLTQKTMFTQFGQIVGTLEYMSPEQARLNQLDIDTRSDVYSLGVLLYELLTGETPFDRKRLRSAAFEEMLRIIREEEPPRPSTRLSGSTERLAIAKRRNQTADRLDKLVKGDLDWIVMKALEKDRGRRYETASSFGADIDRFLNDEAVIARPPSRLYRTRKFVRRNKGPVTATVALFLALIAGICGTTVALVFAYKENTRANDNERQATLNAAQAKSEAWRATANEARARQEAERANQNEHLAKSRADTIEQNLYYAQMNLAGQAAEQRGGIGRVNELLQTFEPKVPGRDLREWEWYYLDSLCHRDLFTLKAHSNPVNSVSWSADGKMLASASDDCSVKIWDTATKKPLHIFDDHTGPVHSVSWCPIGRRLATASADRTVSVWDVTTKKRLHMLDDHTGPVSSVCWSPDGERLATAGGTGLATTGGQSSDTTVRIWSMHTGELMRVLTGHTASVNSLAWSPDGKLLASASGNVRHGSDDQSVRVWDLTTGEAETLNLEGQALSVCWSPDSRLLATGGMGQHIKIWDFAAQRTIHELKSPNGFDRAHSLAWSSHGDWLASAHGEGKCVSIWNITTGKETAVLRGHTEPVISVDWTSDGSRLASASMDGTVKVWDYAIGPETIEMGGFGVDVWEVRWSPDGKQLAFGNQLDRTGSVWDAATGHLLHELGGHTGEVQTVCWNRSGNRLASASRGGEIKIWDAVTGQKELELGKDKEGYMEIFWSPTDDSRLASAGRDNMVRVWDVEQQELVNTFDRHEGRVMSVCWSPDGKRLASSGWRGAVRIWDLATERELLPPRQHTGAVMSVRWSPDGKQLASGGLSGKVRIWNANTGDELGTLQLSGGLVSSVAWSPNGNRLATSSFDGSIEIWDSATRRKTLTLNGSYSTRSVCWSPDGRRLAAASGKFRAPGDQAIRVWDASIGYELDLKNLELSLSE